MTTTETERGPASEQLGGRQPLLRLVDVKKHFPITRGIILQRRIGQVHAVDGIDLEVFPGETVGLVGETGCGKSTTARLITKLLEPTAGQILFEGKDISGPSTIEKPAWFGRFLLGAFLFAFGFLIGGLTSGWPGAIVWVALGLWTVLALGVLYLSVVGAINGWRRARFNHGIRGLRREMAMIFQDPYASLNPRKTVGSIIGEPLKIHGVIPGSDTKRSPVGRQIRGVGVGLQLAGFVAWVVGLATPLSPWIGIFAFLAGIVAVILARIVNRIRLKPWRQAVKREVQRLMELVGLNPEHYNRFPHEFSGGQRQRIGVARALALRPRLVVCDEPVSALDVSIQAQILNLLEDLQEEFNLTYLFIAHDLSVVKHMSDRVAVMYLGKVVEISPGDTLYENPKHPYTGALLSAVPIPDPRLSAQKQRIVLEGDVPSPIDPPSGCRFHPRCPRAQFPTCRDIVPELTPHHRGQLAACHFPLEDRSVIQSTA